MNPGESVASVLQYDPRCQQRIYQISHAAVNNSTSCWAIEPQALREGSNWRLVLDDRLARIAEVPKLESELACLSAGCEVLHLRASNQGFVARLHHLAGPKTLRGSAGSYTAIWTRPWGVEL